MIRAIVFDLDGLIIDTEGPELASWEQVYEAHGVELAWDEWSRGIGTQNGFDPYARLEELTGHAIDRAGVRARRTALFDELMAAQPAMPGVDGVIGQARAIGLKLGIASSSTRAWVERFLGQVGLLDLFDASCCYDDVGCAKPDPTSYRTVLRSLGVQPTEAIALEDSPNGVRAAKAAGLFCVAVPNHITARLSMDEADLVLSTLEDLSLPELVTDLAVRRV